MTVQNPTDVHHLELEQSHLTVLFPDLSSDIDLTCIFTSGEIDAFGAWAEITDSGATTLSSLAATYIMHFSALRIRSTSDADLLYVIELGYGPDASHITTIGPHEFGSGTKKIDSDEQQRLRPLHIPAGQKIYYRMKTENTQNTTATIVIRYHLDN